MKTKHKKVLLLLLSCLRFLPIFAQNLIINPTAEFPLDSGWTILSGNWNDTAFSSTPPKDGLKYFYAGEDSYGEIYQDINVSKYSSAIDLGKATFVFSGYMRSFLQAIPDQSQEVVEYRNASNTVLDSFYSAHVNSDSEWVNVINSQIAPIGTRFIRIRLLSYRKTGTGNDGYHDDLSLTFNISSCDTILCATLNEHQTLTLRAPQGLVFTSINFASYGTPNGSCKNFTFGSCNATSTKHIIDSLALGKNSFSVVAENRVFGDPCVGTIKRLYIQATASCNYKLNQTINFKSIPTKSFGDTSFALHATASSGLPVSFSVDTGLAVISQDSILTIKGGGNITVTASQSGDQVYNPAPPLRQTFEVIKAIQDIIFNAVLDTSSLEERYILSASATSGLPISFSVVSGYGKINGDTLLFTGSGLVTVKAAQPGNKNYEAVDTSITFCVAPNQPGNISGYTLTCKKTQQYSVPVQNGVAFTWSLSGGGTLGNTTGNSVTVDWTSLGTYTLTVTATTQCDTSDKPSRSITINVINSSIPDSATNLYPANGTIINNFPFSLSWKPAAKADLYDIYIWESDSTKPSTATVSNVSQIAYSVYPSVLSHYGAGKIYNWQIISKNGCAQMPGSIQNFSIGYMPDLIALNVNVADTVFSGSSIDITAEIKNTGRMKTSSGFQDAFYLSADTVLDEPRLYPGVDTYLGARPNITALNSGESYQTSVHVVLPEKLIGKNYIIVKANAFANQSEANYNNNTAYKVFQILLTTPPDLVVDSLQTATSVFSGNKINVKYTIRNKGAATIRDSVWKDAIYLSPNKTFIQSEAIKLEELRHFGKLDSLSFYTINDSVTIPQYIFGYYYIHVVTDAEDAVYEVTGENNNIGTSEQINILFTPAPDFIVTQISTKSEATAGESVAVSYTVENIGASKPLQYGTSWTDRFFISHDSVLNNNAIPIGSVLLSPGPTMNNGDIYSKTVNLTIPSNLIGKYYIFVYTDYDNNVYEYHRDTNNINRTSISVNNPDLKDSLISIPVAATAANSIDVSWRVNNIGTGKVLAISRTDIIWMSPTAVFDKAASYNLGSVTYNTTLDTAASIIKEASVNLPNAISGDRYIFIETDAHNTITELNESNNISAGKLIVVAASPDVDLVVDSVRVTPANIKAGDDFSLSYSVSNIDTGSITGKTWTDNIYRSHDTVYNGNATLIRSVENNLTLADSGSYQQTIPFTSSLADLNNNDTARWYYYVVTDARNNIYEHTAENNNTQRSNLLTITHNAFPDLNVTSASGSGALRSGKLTTVTWTVRNDKGTTGMNGYWIDAVYFSQDTVLSGNDILAGVKTIYGPLATGSSYTQKLNVTVPNGISGNYYMLLVTDYAYLNKDINRANNIKTVSTKISNGGGGDTTIVHVGVSASPDLSVSSFSAASAGYSGQPVFVKWIVANNGDTITNKPWNEYIYLSTNANIDASDKLLQTYTRTLPLQKGSFYTDSILVFLPANATGNYYLLFKTDGSDGIYENDENNNTANSFIFIAQPDPCDLTVSNITTPLQAAIADTIPVSWQLNNVGSNPATGYLRQGVYLSKDSVFDAADVLLSNNLYQINVPPSGDSVYSKDIKLTGVQPDSNYVIVRTDLLNNITETNENNNTAASAKKINIQVTDLPINVLTPAILNNYNELYYKVDIPDSLVGGTLLISLKGDSANTLNELYIKLGSTPTRISHDFMYNNPVSGSQDIIIPTLSKGTYYILVYGASLKSSQQNITLKASPLNFEIIDITSNQGGNTGTVTVKITGSKFDPSVNAVLTNTTLGSYTATTIKYINSTSLYATFNLNGAALGTYDFILVKPDIDTALKLNGFTIVPGSGGGITGGTSGGGLVCKIINAGDDASLQTDVITPIRYKPLLVFPMSVIYRNTGNVNMPIPELILQSLSGAGVGDTPEKALLGDLLDLLIKLVEDDGPDDVLRPGATFTKTFYSVLPFDIAHYQYEYRLVGQ